jgi:hypothetical protein
MPKKMALYSKVSAGNQSTDLNLIDPAMTEHQFAQKMRFKLVF